MAVRATQDLKNAIIKTYITASATASTAGRAVKFGATDTEITNAVAGDDAISCGVAMETTAGGGKRVQVIIPGGGVIMPMIVGTGGCTRGVRVKLAADGIIDALVGDKSVGQSVQSGVVGDLVGIRLSNS